MENLKDIPSLDGSFNCAWYIHDSLRNFKLQKLQRCLKRLTPCIDWPNFDKVTALMKEIETMDLELINLIDHNTSKIFQHKIARTMKPENMTEPISEDNSLSDIYYSSSNSSDEEKLKDFKDKIEHYISSYLGNSQNKVDT